MQRHREAFENILNSFESMGYDVVFKLLNANDYDVPQDRKRVIIVGYHKSMGKSFEFPEPVRGKPTLLDSIGDMGEPEPSTEKNKANNVEDLEFPNHEYMTGGFSTIYMSRNRVRSWDEPSFTIQAGGRHAPIHPQAPKMLPVETDKKKFVPGKEHLYRRLSVRECARVQTFPDSFKFFYTGIADGYKMIGNAVPVNLAFHIARAIAEDLTNPKQLQLADLSEEPLVEVVA
jgi:DNA (cytosine-5)-methyltransferase 1